METSLKSFLNLILFSLAVFACEGPVGPEGPTGSPGPAGQTGNAGPVGPQGLSNFKIINFNTTENGWMIEGTEGSEGFQAYFPKSIPEINAQIIDTGFVLTFIRYDEGIWTQLPITLMTGGSDYFSHVNFFYSRHSTANNLNFKIVTSDNDWLDPSLEGFETNVRVVVFTGAPGNRIDIESMKKMSWAELDKYLKNRK